MEDVILHQGFGHGCICEKLAVNFSQKGCSNHMLKTVLVFQFCFCSLT